MFGRRQTLDLQRFHKQIFSLFSKPPRLFCSSLLLRQPRISYYQEYATLKSIRLKVVIASLTAINLQTKLLICLIKGNLPGAVIARLDYVSEEFQKLRLTEKRSYKNYIFLNRFNVWRHVCNLSPNFLEFFFSFLFCFLYHSFARATILAFSLIILLFYLRILGRLCPR